MGRARAGPLAVNAEGRAGRAFARAFGAAPAVLGLAPGRVNLVGEHTDYSGGLVLPFAIDRRCAVAAGPAEAGGLEILAADFHERVTLDREEPLRTIGAEPDGPGRRYPAAVLAELRAWTGEPLPPMRLAIASDVPIGAGLSSSAAVEVATALAAASLLGRGPEGADLASLCRRAEHRAAGVPCGIMDQLASVLGRAGHALLIDCTSLRVTPVPLEPPPGHWFLVIDSGVTHDLAAGEYAKRVETCAKLPEALGVPSLRAASLDRAHATRDQLTDDQLRCARHVITENARVEATVKALHRGDMDEIGRFMNASHDSLRDDYRVSCAELDAIVDAVRRVPGVLGARLTGAGFGGSVLVLGQGAPAGCADAAVRAYEARAFGAPFRTFPVTPAAGAELRRLT